MFAKKNTVHPDTPSVQENPIKQAVALRDEAVLVMVAQALQHQDCFLMYQPVVGANNGSIIGFYEGLIRLVDETGRIIPAADFMPAVENIELGREIDTLALKRGCQALHTDPNLRLSINVSARSIGYQPWVKALNWWLRQNEDIGPRLILEVSEASAMQTPELVVDFMTQQQSRGISFALDGFGSGNLVVRYLKDFLFDIVKIDGQFIRGIANNADNQVLTEAINDMAHKFDMLTVAVQVENEYDAQFLRNIGVDCLQGYHFGAPSPAPEIAQSPDQIRQMRS